VSTFIDFAARYRNMTDDQLLQIASEGGLADGADLLLHSEMASRKLTPQSMSSYKTELLECEREQTENANKSGLFRLFGRRLVSQEGIAQRVEVRTKWFAPRGIPVFPVASYRYARKQKTMGKATVTHEALIGRVPLDWGQVLRTGAISYGLVILTFFLLVVAAEWQGRTHAQ
jgi:hypothetical protein